MEMKQFSQKQQAVLAAALETIHDQLQQKKDPGVVFGVSDIEKIVDSTLEMLKLGPVFSLQLESEERKAAEDPVHPGGFSE